MLAVCFRYTGDMEAAHDVLHDGFIKIFTNFSFRGEASLGTWVTRVMVTQALDYLRGKSGSVSWRYTRNSYLTSPTFRKEGRQGEFPKNS